MPDIAPAAGGQGSSSSALLAAPAAPAAPVAPPTPPTGGAPAVPSGPAWLPGVDEVTAGYVANKGWTEPRQVLDSYVNLEKLLGADRAGNTVILPKDGASAEEMASFYNKLGRPADPSGYKIEVPEGAPKEFATAAAQKLHELGISKAAGEKLAEWWNGQAKGSQEQHQQAQLQAFQQDDQALKQEWGAAFTQNLTAAQAAVRGLGVTPEQIDQMQKSMGHKATMEFFQKIGSKMGEADFVSGNRSEPFGAALTPSQANAKIASLKGDKEFVARYLKKDSAAVAELTRLIAMANPEEK